MSASIERSPETEQILQGVVQAVINLGKEDTYRNRENLASILDSYVKASSLRLLSNVLRQEDV